MRGDYGCPTPTLNWIGCGSLQAAATHVDVCSSDRLVASTESAKRVLDFQPVLPCSLRSPTGIAHSARIPAEEPEAAAFSAMGELGSSLCLAVAGNAGTKRRTTRARIYPARGSNLSMVVPLVRNFLDGPSRGRMGGSRRQQKGPCRAGFPHRACSGHNSEDFCILQKQRHDASTKSEPILRPLPLARNKSSTRQPLADLRAMIGA